MRAARGARAAGVSRVRRGGRHQECSAHPRQFERALESRGDASDFRSGIELIYRQFQDALQKIGVQAIAAVGSRLIPEFTKRSKWWIRPKRRTIMCSRNCSVATSSRSACCVRHGAGGSQQPGCFDSFATCKNVVSRWPLVVGSLPFCQRPRANEQRLTTDDRIQTVGSFLAAKHKTRLLRGVGRHPSVDRR